jgi:hypothetical protein
MTTFVYRNGKLVDKNVAGPKNTRLTKVLGVISDIMPETRHMADGKYYTSKSQFRQATRAAGCVEVGNETSTLLKPRQPIRLDEGKRREDIKRTIYDLRNRK